MYRLLLILGLLIILYFLVKKALREFNRPSLPSGSAGHDQMIQDPVCRTYIPRANAVSASIGGQNYYFCSTDCAQTFHKQLSG